MDLNHRPPGPEPGALARLRYAPTDTLRRITAIQADSQINIAPRWRLLNSVTLLPAQVLRCTVTRTRRVSRFSAKNAAGAQGIVPRQFRTSNYQKENRTPTCISRRPSVLPP